MGMTEGNVLSFLFLSCYLFRTFALLQLVWATVRDSFLLGAALVF
jgi:hypothetical protein